MLHSPIHNARESAGALQRRAADEHRKRMERISSAAVVQKVATSAARPFAPRPMPAEPDLPAIPDAMMEWAHAQIDASRSVMGEVERIQRAVLAVFPGVSFNDIRSARRTAVVVKPRQVAMYLTKELTTRSLPEIGRRFGGRDHTTVLHAIRKIKHLLGIDLELAGLIDTIKASLAETM